ATTAEPADNYVSPQASAGTEEGVVFGQSHVLWDKPVPPGGAVAWTTPPLHDDVEALGPASLDVWLSSTAPDTDLQATITEVRPDGQEVYVQKGWLRASHRVEDPSRSTTLRPYQTHREADAVPLAPGQPTLMRVELFPFGT